MSETLYFTGLFRYELSGDFSGWQVGFIRNEPENGLEIAKWTFHAKTPSAYPKLAIAFSMPLRDVQLKWEAPGILSESHHLTPFWFHGNRCRTNLGCGIPMACYLNQAGTNRLCVALSDALHDSNLTSGAYETGCLGVKYDLFNGTETPQTEFSFSLRVDCRERFYAESLCDVSRWYEEFYPPCSVPEAGYLPYYSTWYQFQRDVSQQKLEREIPAIKAAGFTGMILDAGWQCERTNGGGSDLTSCGYGDWNAFPGKFPDMSGFSKKLHAANLKFLLWIGTPFVSHCSLAYSRLRTKSLRECDPLVIDPRYRDARDFLVSKLRELLIQWNLDGFKLDFVDHFFCVDNDPAAKTNYEGCDFHNIPEAVNALFSELHDTLKKENPNILIEFRQCYNGPAMRQYANLFRASDCPFDLIQNRVRTIDLRLLSGSSAVHSDMAIWAKTETPEAAALQILNVLFSTPQISVSPTDMPENQRRMLDFWLGFCADHKETLQLSELHPESPDQSYPIVSAESAREKITAVYSSNRLVSGFPSGKLWMIVNATHTPELALALPCGEYSMETLDVFGSSCGKSKLIGGTQKIAVPCSGFAVIAQRTSKCCKK